MAEEKRTVAVTFKIQVDGFGADLSADLYVDELPGLVKKLRAVGVTPANSPYVWESKPTEQGGTGSEGIAPLCPTHGSRMKPSKKGGGWFCPRKVDDGSYCKEKSG